MDSILESVEAPLKRFGESAWKWLLGLGSASVGIGVIALVWPDHTMRVVGVLVGVYLLISGIAALGVGLTAPMPVLVRVLGVLTGVLFILVGVLCFRSEVQSLWLLALLLGMGWISTGITQLIRGLFSSWPYGGQSVLSGILLIANGIVVLVYPVNSIFVLVIIVSIVFIIDGVLDVVSALRLRSELHSLIPRIDSGKRSPAQQTESDNGAVDAD